MVYHWSLNNCRSPQVSRTLLSILTDLKNAVDVWMVSILSIIFIYLSIFSNTLETVPSAPSTNGITGTLMYPSFFQLFCKVQVFLYLFFFLLFSFCDPLEQKNSLKENFFFCLLLFFLISFFSFFCFVG